jgi:hypothetical protein
MTMRYEILKLMDENEVRGLADAFRISQEEKSFDEICREVAAAMKEE